MSKFHGRDHFAAPSEYRLLPLRLGRLDEQRYVVTNDVGEYHVASRDDVTQLIRGSLPQQSSTYRSFKSKHFLFDDDSACAIDLLALKYRTRAEPISRFTGLHIFVVSLRCDHSCHYCQVSRQTEDKSAYDMTPDAAERALELTFRSPSPQIKIEFQGGEPLLNFGLVRHIVERAEQLNQQHRRDLAFVLATNLARLDAEVLDYCRDHQIYLSTSLDGPNDLHDAHRPLRGGSSHAATIEGIKRVRAVLGPHFISALMTTTPDSLDRVEEIIDEYVRQDFRSIFLRPLSPYGFAARSSLAHKYDVENWLSFYKRGIKHVVSLNQRGYAFREEYTAIILSKMFAPAGSRYVDLQSPAGIGIGAIVFNYDGHVYASDEGRMLAEMGDLSFRLGHVATASYEEIMTAEQLLGPLEETLLESSPMCSDCPFLPYCGADPVFHKATLGDVLGHKAFSAFCQRHMGIFRHILTLLEDDPDARDILLSWI